MSRLGYALILVGILNSFSCSVATKRDAPSSSPPATTTSGAAEAAPKSYAEQTSDGMVVKMKPSGKVLTNPEESVTDRVFAEKAIAGLPNGGDISHLRDVTEKNEPVLKTKVPAPEAETAAEVASVPIPTKIQANPEAVAVPARTQGPVSWSQALGWMKNGNLRFTKGRFRKDGQSLADVRRLAAGQKPHTIVLSCSDSRVPPEIVFDEKLGEIFVIRVAGEMLDSGTVGSIEYAVERLGANLILVLGHTSCGAVIAAHNNLSGAHVVSSAYDKMIADIQPRVATYAGKAPSRGYVKESWSNVKGVAKDLLERSADIAAAVKTGNLKIAEAMYDTSSGVVTFW